MAPRNSPHEKAVPLSVLLRTLPDLGGKVVTVGEVIAHFGPRAFGALLFVFALPNLLPLPPGSTTLLGLPLLLFAPQLALGSQQPWLPQRLRTRAFDAAALRKIGTRASVWVERAEALTTRRGAFMFGPLGAALIGIVCTLLAVVLILPIPLGNLLPAFTIAVFGLSLVQRDGLLALVGYALASASAGALVVAANIILALLARASTWFNAAGV
jgi:hypothetical protein